MRRFCGFCLLLLTLCLIPVHAFFITDDTWGYTLDLPEGFTLQDGNGTDRYQFVSSVVPVNVLIIAYDKNQQKNTKEATENVLNQINAVSSPVQTYWQRKQCTIGQFTMQQNNEHFSGWILALELEKGFAVFVTFTQQKEALNNEHFMISILDSISFGGQTLAETGPMTTFAWQNEGNITQNIQIDAKKITVTVDKIDSDANQYIVDREFAILELYKKSPLWKEAWERFYRIIYRDAYKRLERSAKSIYESLEITNPHALASALLQWVQVLPYKRDTQNSDFTSLPAVFLGKISDCDSRSLLLAVLLKHMNVQTVIFVSPEYSHALVGFDIAGSGARMSVDNVSYLVGETTAKIPIGMISATISNPDKWLPISFYDF